MRALRPLATIIGVCGVALVAQAGTAPSPGPVDAGRPTLADSEPDAVIAADLRAFVNDGSAEAALLKHLKQSARATAKKLDGLGAKSTDIDDALRLQIAQNLEDKRALATDGGLFPMTASEIEREVIDYEAFKLETYVRSGVFPKRYFGYFDGKWDTAPYEATLMRTAHGAATTANAYLAAHGSKIRVSDQEIAVTFIAEGGAILLREKQAELDDIHPVLGIGLDDIATGFKLYPELVQQLDAQFATNLGNIVSWQNGQPYLTRNFKFAEAVLGTTVMWVYEKERCEKLLLAKQRASLSMRDGADQFILASLVYNSGQLFDDGRVAQIRGFTTGDYVYELSEKMKAKRFALPVRPPAESLKVLLESGAYADQQTTWSTVYHVLQRYGAYVSLKAFSDTFDAKGTFRRVP
ncbi:MAG: hypothetical protein JST54_30605 [Deltaproteobacteria bacterium]|nr:hypothetical protein [Deltaproteobacteria bacterium]